MVKSNIFRPGGIVRGESMIGYSRYINSLKEYAFDEGDSIGISVTGMHQVGKTSLMMSICEEADKQKDRFISVYIDLCEIKLDNGTGLMYELIKSTSQILARELKKRGKLCGLIEEDYNIINSFSKDNSEYRSSFKSYFEDIGELFHIIWIIDEFDTAEILTNADNELLRNIMTHYKYNTTLFLVSRRQIKNIVSDNQSNSWLPAAVKSEYIKGFDIDDKEMYFNILKEKYNYNLTDEQKRIIEYYAGCIPVIYSRIGNRIAYNMIDGLDLKLDDILQSLSNEIHQYYEMVYSRLKKDGYIERIFAIVVGPHIGITAQDVDALESMGYLLHDSYEFYSFSKYFKLYMINNIQPDVSEWDGLISVEKEIKLMLEDQMKRFGIQASNKAAYEQFLKVYFQKINRQYDPKKYDSFIYSTKRDFHHESSLLEVMSLEDTIKCFVEPLWRECFSQYFNNSTYGEWRQIFESCYKARNPLAHGHREYLNTNDLAIIRGYCSKVLGTVESTKGTINKGPLILSPAYKV